MTRPHIPKVDTGDDYDFMCGTCAFGAVVSTRQLCMNCVKKTLEIVELLASAYDELASTGAMIPKRRAALMKRIDKALGNRPKVHYSEPPP